MTAAAFFDLDRTLISGTSAFPFGLEAWRQGMADPGDIVGWAFGALNFLIAGDKGQGASLDVRTEFLNRIKGSSVADLDRISQAVVPKLEARVRPESRKLIAMHHEAGRETWIVSASPQSIVGPMALVLGMTGALGTEAEVRDGRYTGELDGPFMYGVGKVEAMEKLAKERGYDMERSYAYSDSVSDLPMMESVGHPVAVNPDSHLDTIAHERGWPIVIFARRTKQAFALSGVAVASLTAASVAYALGRKHGRGATLASIARPASED